MSKNTPKVPEPTRPDDYPYVLELVERRRALTAKVSDAERQIEALRSRKKDAENPRVDKSAAERMAHGDPVGVRAEVDVESIKAQIQRLDVERRQSRDAIEIIDHTLIPQTVRRASEEYWRDHLGPKVEPIQAALGPAVLECQRLLHLLRQAVLDADRAGFKVAHRVLGIYEHRALTRLGRDLHDATSDARSLLAELVECGLLKQPIADQHLSALGIDSK